MGRPKSDNKLVPVMVRMAADEIVAVDERRGDQSRSDFIRKAAANSPVGGNALGEVSAPPTAVPRPPTHRTLMARIVGSMHDLDPEDGGPVLTAEEAIVVQGWSTRIVKAWQASLGVGTERRPGRVIEPGDREAKADAIGGTADPANCKHPKQNRQNLGYMVKCGLCDTKVA